MTTITSLTSNSSYGLNSKGIGGLATGLDTDAIMKGMTLGTRTKIAKQLQSKQLLAWQTDAYRSVSNKLIGFSKKYTSYTSSTNLSSPTFYLQNEITTSGSNSTKVSVSGTSTMTDSLSIISATQASSGGAISNSDASAKLLASDTDLNFAVNNISTLNGASIDVTYDGQTYSVALKGTIDGKYPDINSLSNDINAKLANMDILDSGGSPTGEKLSTKISFSNDGTKLSIKNDSPDKSLAISEFSASVKSVLGFESSVFENGKLNISAGDTSTGVDIGALTKDISFSDALTGKYISFSFNTTVKSISFSKEELDAVNDVDASGPDGVDNKDELKAAFQAKLDTAFGAGSISVALDGSKLTFKTADSGAVFKVSEIDSEASSILGISKGDSNRLDLNKALTLPVGPVLDIEGTNVVLTGVDTIQKLMDAVNTSGSGITMSYIESLDRFEFKSSSSSKIAITGNVAETLFGGAINVLASKPATMTVKYGNAAEIKLESNNNTFSLDGLTIKVNESFTSLYDYDKDIGTPDTGSGDAVKLSSKTDTTKVLTAVKDMVKDYNEMVDLVNSELSTKRNRNYAPLTDEQKEDMSESEIKVWEEKAKQGMLFGNNDMSALSGDLRSVFFSSGSAMANLEAIGISTSKDYRDNGKIIIDEEKLKSAIDADPENIKKIFSDKMTNVKNADGTDLLINGKTVSDTTSGGVMSRLQNLTTKYSKTEGSSKGILIEKAGNTSAPLSLTKNGLLDKMNSIDTIVTNLKRTLAAEQKRYQNQFTNLERVISSLNSQSSWLSQQ